MNARRKIFLISSDAHIYEENARGQIIGDLCGMIKLVFSPVDKKLLGAHIIGEQASELIHVASHVMLAKGANRRVY